MSALAHLTPAQLARTPASYPSPGIIPNFVDPHSTGPVFIIVGAIMICLMLVIASLRFYTKIFVLRNTTLDDCRCAPNIFGLETCCNTTLLRARVKILQFLHLLYKSRRHIYIQLLTMTIAASIYRKISSLSVCPSGIRIFY
jgi:hypothetical protein